MAGNLIIAKFIGALAIRPTMMIVMAWSSVISVREAMTFFELLETSGIPNTSGIKLQDRKVNLPLIYNFSNRVQTEKKILDSVSFSLGQNMCGPR